MSWFKRFLFKTKHTENADEKLVLQKQLKKYRPT